MGTFMIMMRENDDAWEAFSEDERQQLLEKYYAWARKLRDAGRMHGGDALSKGGRVLRSVGGEIVDGPFTETKEVITGYFLIEADSLEHAAEIARECPALGHGETVVVRETGHHSG